MKRLIFTLIVIIACFGTAPAFSGFTPVAGASGNISYSMETAVSGFSVGADGTTVCHGTVVSPAATGTGVSSTLDIQTPAVSVYTLDGILIYHSECGDFDPESLPAGLYLVRRGNSMQKLLRPH